MSGIYIHIPFCKKKCYYCDFFTQIGLKNKDEFLIAVKKEIENRKNYLKNETVETIYFGGGTPSLLQADEIENILETVFQNFKIFGNPEMTLEANPDDIEKKYLLELISAGINRVSIGIQSFFDDDLLLMNRRHNSEQAHRAVELIFDSGITNLSGDLIYGLPNSDGEKWKSNLQTFFDLKIPHLSAYHLSYEENTVFSKFLKNKKIKTLEEEKSIEQFNILCGESERRGYEHYEISNFALPGCISQHNSAYWMQKNYLGIGPSAHSFDGVTRSWNFSNLSKYIQRILEGKLHFEEEILTKNELYNDYIITSLRTAWGANIDIIKEKFNEKFFEHCLNNSKKYIETGKILLKNKTLTLSNEGKLISDKIFEDLIFI
jgi:oxygen-independent coproporphyrinogen-3 oxidase